MRSFLALAQLSLASAYCDAGNTVPGDSSLGQVFLAGETKAIDDQANVCPNPTGLQDRTSFSADLRVGVAASLRFKAVTCNQGWARYAYAFIDFNRNGTYDANELLGTLSIDSRTEPVDVVFDFTPPVWSVAGDTRMRVFVVESGSGTPNPCLTFGYGGVKEYSITLTTGPPGPGASCCLPTTYSSVARVRDGTYLTTVYQYQDNEKQAYLQRTEWAGETETSSLLCLADRQLCWTYTPTTCQKYTFFWPAQECPGSNSSKFKFDTKMELVPGFELSIYTQPGVAITVVPLENWCVYNSVVPGNSAYTYWDLNPPAAVFDLPAWCATSDPSSKLLPPPAVRRS